MPTLHEITEDESFSRDPFLSQEEVTQILIGAGCIQGSDQIIPSSDLKNTSENPMDSELIAHRVSAASAAFQAYREQKAELDRSVKGWLHSRVNIGEIYNFSHQSRKEGKVPKFMRNMRVMSGNARGSKVFRIDQIVDVEINMSFVNLASWTCKATPISEKTGKPMSGRVAKSLAYGANTDKSLVTLKFDFFPDRDFDIGGK